MGRMGLVDTEKITNIRFQVCNAKKAKQHPTQIVHLFK